jgi:NAD(P)-dependent dehydrogenase (short-subunit alcohol dehydrogenase family)
MLDRFTGSSDRKAGLVAGVPLKRAGRPEEIADAIVFVASAKSPSQDFFMDYRVFGA